MRGLPGAGRGAAAGPRAPAASLLPSRSAPAGARFGQMPGRGRAAPAGARFGQMPRPTAPGRLRAGRSARRAECAACGAGSPRAGRHTGKRGGQGLFRFCVLRSAHRGSHSGGNAQRPLPVGSRSMYHICSCFASDASPRWRLNLRCEERTPLPGGLEGREAPGDIRYDAGEPLLRTRKGWCASQDLRDVKFRQRSGRPGWLRPDRTAMRWTVPVNSRPDLPYRHFGASSPNQ
jgi:hypothetical protein